MLGRYFVLLLILPYSLHIENMEGIKAGTSFSPKVFELKPGLPVSVSA